MHDALLGDIRGLLCLLLAKTNILEYVREWDFCVYVKLSALTRSQQTYKKKEKGLIVHAAVHPDYAEQHSTI